VVLVLGLGLATTSAPARAATAPPFTTAPGQGPAFDGYAPGLPDSGPLGLRWRRDLDGPAVAGPELVYVLRQGRELSAFSWQTGLTRWSRVRSGDALDAEYGLPQALATDGEAVVVVSGNELYARDAGTGALRWTADVPELSPTEWWTRISSPRIAVADGVVVVQVLGGIQAFDLASGRRLWTQEEPGEATFAVDDDTVGIGTDDHYDCHLRAVDLRTGTQRWLVEHADGACFSADLSAHDGTITWVDTRRSSDGAFVRAQPADLSSWPIRGDGRVFYRAYTDDGLRLVGATSAGEVLWRGPEEPRDVEGAAPAAVGPGSVLTSRHDPDDPTGRTYALQLLAPATGAPIGAPFVSEAGASRESVVVGDGAVLAGGSVVAPGGSAISFPGRRVLVAGGSAYEVPDDEFDTFVRDPRPAVPFRAPEGATAECRVDDGAWEPCTSPWRTPDLGPDGEHAVDVRSSRSAPAARLVLVLDREAPSVGVTGGVSGTVGASAQPFPSFRLSSDDPLARFECALDGDEWTSCGVVHGVSTEGGPHVLRARAVDRNGNRSAVEERRWTVDLQPPTVAIATMPRPVRTTTVEIPFTVSADAVAVRCAVYEWLGNHEEVTAPLAPCAGSWRGTLHERPDGSFTSYRLLVVATDEYGNEVYEERGFNLDLAQRGYRRVGSGDLLARMDGQDRHVARLEVEADEDVRGAAECRLAELTVWRSCRVDAPLYSTRAYVELPVAPSAGSGFSVPRADGRHEVLVRGVDRWGSRGDAVSATVLVDVTGPSVDDSGFPADGRPAGQVAFPLPVTDGGSGVDRLLCTVAPPDDPFHDRAVACDGGTFRADLEAGAHLLVVQATDVAGNETRLERRLVVGPAPDPGGGTGTTSTTTDAAAPTTTVPVTTTPGATPARTTTASAPPVPARPSTPGPARPAPTGGSPAGPVRAAPCRATRATRTRPPRITAVVRRSGRIVLRATVPGASPRRPAHLEVQARTGCGGWRTVRRRTARGPVRLTTVPVLDDVDAVRVRARIGGRVVLSASRAVP
jgi:outer membrane protein assembly factor BamB